jgi:hypothetical protein
MPPTALLDSLQAVRRKVKLLSIGFGAGIVLACAVGFVVTAAFLDWLLVMPTFPRLLLVIASVGGIAMAIWHFIAKPALARLSLTDLAGRLENAFPTFDDRLRSTVNFVHGSQESTGSAVMKDRVVTEATQMASNVNLSSALLVRPVLWSMGGGLAAIGLLVLLGALVGSEYLNPAITRLLNPFSDKPWPKRVQISAMSLPARVQMGSKVNVAMKLTKGDKASARAIVYYQYDQGPIQMVNMAREKDGTYLAALDAKGGSLKTWIESGDDKTPAASIAVVQRLAIQGVSLAVTPPKYTGLETFAVDLATKPTIVFGSKVALRISFNKPLDPKADVVIEPIKSSAILPAMQWDRTDAAKPVAAWDARESLRFHVRATDTDGFTNGGLEDFELLVVRDQPPRVVIERPNDKVSMTPDGTVHLQIKAEDDFDIRSMTLVVDRIKRADKSTTQPSTDHWAIELSGWEKADRTSELQPFRLKHDWELAKLNNAKLTPGDALEYSVQVRDNFELDGQTHAPQSSRRMELAIISQKDLEDIIIGGLRQISEEVAQVQNSQRNTKEATRQLQQDTKDKPQFSKADREVADKRINDQSTLSSQTRTIAQRVSQLQQRLADNRSPSQELKDLTNDVKNDLERAAERPMKEATDKLSEAVRQGTNPQNSQNQSQNGQQQQGQQGQQDQQRQQEERQPGERQQGERQQGEQQPREGQQQQGGQQQGQRQQGQQQNGQQQNGQQQNGQQQQQQGQQPQQQPRDPQERRNEALALAQTNQQKADEQLQQALDRMKNIGTLSKAIESIQQILDRQRKTSAETAKIGKENLGKRPEELSKEAREQLEKNAKDQSQLSKDTQKATDELQKTAQQMQRSDQAAAEAMRQAAQTSQQQAVPQKQQEASEKTEQNQQAQAQNDQKQAELGLQMMLDTLREAERRKLEKLVRQLDNAIQAVQNLIRQQAGHNIDNLLNQGGDKTKLVTDDLLIKSKRVRDHLPPLPPVPALTGLQEQTERNTSDVLKTLGEVPGGAEASANLNRASTKMGYAIVSLRDKKLIEAYDPHQTEALAALEAALAKLQEQRQVAQNRIDQQQKAKIREAYVKIREDQVKLNDSTTKLDGAKQPDGTLKRVDQIELGKLPGAQGQLSDRTKKIGEDLAGISIVYQWANSDITKSMDEVKDDLAKPETGTPTQAEQTRIVEQLTAMIDNLAVKPPEKSQFEQKGGGQGQGQGQGQQQQKKRLPSEAELKLLKDLQIAVNKNTIKINDQPEKDKPRLTALGGRQGELRDLLDKLLKQATNGQQGLPPKPDKADQLPEEASVEKVEDQELDKDLLQDKPLEEKATKDIGLIGDRMARSQQRLQDNHDPGKTTQIIQDRIVKNMDDLITMARQQQQQRQQQRQQGQGEEQQAQRPDQGDAQAQNQGQQQGEQSQPNQGQQAAQADTARAADENNAQLKDMKETAEQWGAISPRLHDAVLEGAGEKVPEKYRKMVQDYYKSLATKATEGK